MSRACHVSNLLALGSTAFDASDWRFGNFLRDRCIVAAIAGVARRERAIYPFGTPCDDETNPNGSAFAYI